MTCPSEEIFPGYTQFSIDRELYEFGIDYANPYGKLKPMKGGMLMEA